MKIRIRDDASQGYVGRCTHGRGFNPVNWDWAEKLKLIAGMVLDVETEFLFRDQFNVGPIPGVSEIGLRLTNSDVAEVIDDIRPSKMRCDWCGTASDIGDFCPKCGRLDYLKKFADMYLWVGEPKTETNEKDNV